MEINLRKGEVYDSKGSILLFLTEEQIKNLDGKLIDLADASIHAEDFKGKKNEKLVVPELFTKLLTLINGFTLSIPLNE